MINYYVYDFVFYRNDILLMNKNNKYVFLFSVLVIIFFVLRWWILINLICLFVFILFWNLVVFFFI